MATTVLGLKTFAASDPVDYNEINDNYNKIDNGVKTALQGRAAHNLLDNSNFQINQRGITSTEASGYHVDRWKKENSSGKVTVGNGYLSMTGTGTYWFLTQFVQTNKIKSGAVYTIALADTSGSVSVCSTVMSTDMAKFTARHTFTSGAVVTTNVEYTSDKYAVYFTSNSSAETRFAWAALYEGSYDASTLPAYQPKGYAAELAECQRQFERLGGTFSQFLGNAVFAKAGAKSVIISIKYSPKRLSNPTLSFSNPSEYRMLQKDAVNASTISAYSITSFDNITTETPFAFFRVNLANALASDSWLILQRSDGATGAYIDVNADM